MRARSLISVVLLAGLMTSRLLALSCPASSFSTDQHGSADASAHHSSHAGGSRPDQQQSDPAPAESCWMMATCGATFVRAAIIFAVTAGPAATETIVQSIGTYASLTPPIRTPPPRI